MADTIVRTLANAVLVLSNPPGSLPESTLDVWREMVRRIDWTCLPYGSGFDSGSHLSLDRSRPDRLVFETEFHHMNEAGFYIRWTAHDVVVTPSFWGIDVRVTGVDHKGIKDFIASAYHATLGEPLPESCTFDVCRAALAQEALWRNA